MFIICSTSALNGKDYHLLSHNNLQKIEMISSSWQEANNFLNLTERTLSKHEVLSRDLSCYRLNEARD